MALGASGASSTVTVLPEAAEMLRGSQQRQVGQGWIVGSALQLPSTYRAHLVDPVLQLLLHLIGDALRIVLQFCA